MSQASKTDSKQTPGVIATITAGFEFTTSHLWLIAIPILLDLYLWLGPRLSIEPLIERTQRVLSRDPNLIEMAEQIGDVTTGFNLFTSLSIPLVGIPALFGGISPDKTPLVPARLIVSSTTEFVVLFILLTVIGLGLSALYLSLIGRVLNEVEDDFSLGNVQWIGFGKSVVLSWIRLLGLGVFILFTLLVIMLPLIPMAYIFALVSQGLAILVLMVGVVTVMTYLSMSVPSIVMDSRRVGMSIVYSVRLVRKYLLPTMNLLLLVVLIGWGTNLLWQIADAGNWLTLVSIVGHGFVSTALASAIFIFYKDRSDARLPRFEDSK